jgi:uncharacterized protein (DUF433 family)
VKVVNVAAEAPRGEILRDDPALTGAGVEAALAYAAELATEGVVDLRLETKA